MLLLFLLVLWLVVVGVVDGSNEEDEQRVEAHNERDGMGNGHDEGREWSGSDGMGNGHTTRGMGWAMGMMKGGSGSDQWRWDGQWDGQWA